ncbi:LysR family transcriptional regulator [Acinetobacter qingfengensis]|uniref:RpiR family transcriptional regulator n=1 Tax=Acinetobacter qingfengensis TaxID=1262585 RepID=A0A1E7R3V6_9GAMM|nr:LysR substrate-binding domain-containing protein [Acinetobacter qingfengensis]KAA8731489.1 LysR family transcriptional regulator [Acinetobacter qingfengensis]OEY93971.1 RpiR family transcriptional regulator [Acinetobacter qingfengensis]
MELRRLRYFITVAEELNFSRAAQRLYTAQPSLSQQIKDLEDKLGFNLFHRTKRKVELTHEGISFLPYAQAILNQVENMVAKTRMVAKEEKNLLKIGFVPVAESKIFPYVLPTLRFENPDLKLFLQSMCANKQREALINADIDIALVRENIQSDSIQSQLILREEMVFLLPKSHSLNKSPKITAKSLEGISLIIPDENYAPTLHHSIKDFFNTHQVTVNYIQVAENIIFNINSVSMGLGCAILPSYVLPIVKNNNAIVVKELGEELPLLNLFACYHKHNNQANIQKFLNQVARKIKI